MMRLHEMTAGILGGVNESGGYRKGLTVVFGEMFVEWKIWDSVTGCSGVGKWDKIFYEESC